MILLIRVHNRLPCTLRNSNIRLITLQTSLKKEFTYTYTYIHALYVFICVCRERKRNSQIDDCLTAEPDSRPNIFRLSGVDFIRISYILLDSK